jgi:hypothetical protein
MRLGPSSGFRDLAIFLIVFAVLLAIGSRALSNVIALAWFAFVLLASLFLIFKGWKARGSMKGPGGWGAVLPQKVWRWMLGENEAESESKRERGARTGKRQKRENS